MKYIFSLPEPFTRFVKIEMIIKVTGDKDQLELQLPAWRPGRYETVNFAKNIRFFHVTDSAGKALPFKKQSKDLWLVQISSAKTVHVHYEYYAAQPDAGACYIDRDQLYINPVHCCFYIPGRENEKCEVQLNIPENWKIACGMQQTEDRTMIADDFDRLVDSPFIASPSLKHATYKMNDIDFNIWIQGECNPDWDRIVGDFKAFTKVQLEMMKHFPAKDYHFLVQLLPGKFYHGVEHINSTVLAMGPGNKLMEPGFYSDFTGVASHELFHVWNVKSIRPVEMHPYRFNDENYATTGYVYEGVTTYYGDLILGRSGFFTFQELLDQYSIRFQKHMDNPGRFNYSVAESSFDTWLDGYVPGIPGRKVSIYDEGCLLAWALDFMIRSATESKRSLNDVMYILYHDYALKGKGYSQEDYKKIAEEVAGRDFNNFFDEYVYKASSLESLLGEVLSLSGIAIEKSGSDIISQRKLGLKLIKGDGTWIVSAVYPGSPAAEAGIVKDDAIIAINDNNCSDDIEQVIAYSIALNNRLALTIKSNGKILNVPITVNEQEYYSKYRFVASKQLTAGQEKFKSTWISAE